MTKVNPELERQGSQYALTLFAEEIVLRTVQGREALGEPSRFEASFSTTPANLANPALLCGTSVDLVIRRLGELERRIAVEITDVVVDVTHPSSRDVEVVLESAHARLRHKVDNRIFRDRTVPTIVRELLAESNVFVEERLQGTYPMRPYTVQWNESTLDFVHRLLEEEGIAYVVADAPEPGSKTPRDRIFLCDGRHAYGDPRELPFVPRSRLERSASAVTSLRHRARMVAGKVLVRDFSTARPDLPIEGTAKIEGAGATRAEVYLYPGLVAQDAVAAQRARAVADALSTEAAGYDGSADALSLAPGQLVTVIDLPLFGDETGRLELLVTEIAHEHRDRDVTGSAASLAFGAIAGAGPTFRPMRRTPKPLAPGFQEGVVCGPPGEDIHTDAMGRVKVHFPWDRHLPHDDIASDWIPVLQDNTGTSAAIPRVGWEVLTSFVDGDPDRPVVAGRLYNPKDPFPEPLPAGKTRTAIRSLSSPTRDGENAIVMEDAAGQELIKMRAEKDREILIANDKREMVRDTDAEIVVKDQAVRIGGDRTTTVASSVLRYVSGDESLRVGGAHTQKIGAGEQTVVDGDATLKVGSTHIRTIGGTDKVTSKSSLSEMVGGVVVEASLKENQTTATMVETLTVGGAVVEIAGTEKSEQAERLRLERIGGMVATSAFSSYALKVVGPRKTTTGKLDIEAIQSDAFGPPAPSVITLSSTEAFAMKAKTSAKLNAAKEIVLQVGATTLTLAEGGVFIDTPGTVIVNASAGAKIKGDKAQENEK